MDGTRTPAGNLSASLDRVYLPQSEWGALETALSRRATFGQILSPSYMQREDPLYHVASTTSARVLEYGIDLWKVDRPIWFCVLDNEDHENAMAIAIPSGFVIVIFTGMFKRLFNFSSLMILSEPVIETFDLKLQPVYHRDGSVREQANAGENQEINHRALTGFFCGMIAATTFHELAHIVNGHLNFLRMLQRRSAPTTRRFWGTEIERKRTRETLEYDADAAAGSGMMAFFARGKGIPGVFAPYAEPVEARYKFAAACVSGCYLYEDMIFVPVDGWAENARTHSPAQVRSFNTIGTAIEVYKKLLDVDYRTATEQMMPTYLAVVECSAMLRKTKPSQADIGMLDPEKSATYTDRIHGRWAAIRPYLTRLKLSNVGQLAPVQAEPA